MYKRFHKYDSVGSKGKGKQNSKRCTQVAIVSTLFVRTVLRPDLAKSRMSIPVNEA